MSNFTQDMANPSAYSREKEMCALEAKRGQKSKKNRIFLNRESGPKIQDPLLSEMMRIVLSS